MPNRQPYQQRVINERRDLDEKILKLTGFIDTVQFMQLPEDEQDLMLDQLRVMRQYTDLVDKRIKLFSQEPEDG